MAKRVHSSKNSTLNWAYLPDELLDLILNNLVALVDYVRFSAVCKQWNSIASNQKEKFMRLSKHQLPWLLIETCKRKFTLYNFITTIEEFNFQTRIPEKLGFCFGSSQGWLIFESASDSLALVNPLSGANLLLPQFDSTRFCEASKVILSRNPSFGRFEVLALSSDFAAVAHLKFGDEFWTYSIMSISDSDSFIFYKDRILSASSNGGIWSLDVVDDHVDDDCCHPSKCIKIEEIATDIDILAESFLVEATNGDLVMVLKRFYMNGFERYKMYKLVEQANGLLERVPVANLGGDSLFLGGNESISVSAMNYSGYCRPNTIYHSHGKKPDDNFLVETFNLEDGSLELDYASFSFEASESWIVPTIS